MRKKISHCLLILTAVVSIVNFLHFFSVHYRGDYLSSSSEATEDLLDGFRLYSRRRKSSDQRIYLPYDKAGIRPCPGTTAKSHRLPNAIPESRTIPFLQAENMTFHLQQRKNTSTRATLGWPHVKKNGTFNWDHDYGHDFRTLYVYNPSILPLMQTGGHDDVDDMMLDSDPDFLSPQDLRALTGGDDSVQYVVVYRAYTGCNCFIDPKRSIMTADEQISYVVVALMDEKLDIIDGTDVLIDLNAGPGLGKYFRQFREDCRVSLHRGSIYLLCNEQLHRIRIVRSNNETAHESAKINQYGTGRQVDELPYRYPNIYGNGLHVILDSTHRKIGGGKNFNLFRHLRSQTVAKPEVPTVGAFDYYVQLLPLPHQYQRINLPALNETGLDLYPRGWDPPQKSRAVVPDSSFDTPDVFHPIRICVNENDESDSVVSSDNTSQKSTVEGNSSVETNCSKARDIPFFPQDDHGTACCVSMTLPGRTNSENETSVMVGISHIKLSPRNPFWKRDIYHRYDHLAHDQFVSRFVAYQDSPPFDIVAVSGWWCPGFGDLTPTHSLAGRNKEKRLNLFDQTFDCPAIHFVSGLSEHVTDPSKVIIGYGVNDCYASIMEVSKADILSRLSMPETVGTLR